MSNRCLIIFPIIALGCLGINAQAMDVKATFNELDKNADGSLSKAEAKEDAVLHENFSQIDTDQNGQLSFDEFNQFIQ
jgi:Ca2+-binding EF-hand superfamily protein